MVIVTNFLPVCLVLFSAISVKEIACEKDAATVEKDAAGGIDIDLHISYVPTGEEVKSHEHHHHHHRHHKDQAKNDKTTSTPDSRRNSNEEGNNDGTTEKTIEVYKDEELRGGSETLTLKKDKCHNLHESWNDKISSIDTNGACILVWEHADCNGRHARLRPDNSYSSRKLHHVRMNDEISSLELC